MVEREKNMTPWSDHGVRSRSKLAAGYSLLCPVKPRPARPDQCRRARNTSIYTQKDSCSKFIPLQGYAPRSAFDWMCALASAKSVRQTIMTSVPQILGYMQLYASTETYEESRVAGTTQNSGISAWCYDHTAQKPLIGWLVSISGWIMDEPL